MRKTEVAQFKQVFDKYYNPLCNYATSIVNDSQAAEDLVQHLFIQLWEKSVLKSVENIQAYLLRSTKFKCVDYLRSVKKEIIPIQSIPEPQHTDSHFKEEDIIPLLHFFAATLPSKTREVFLMSRIDGYSNQQIADKLELSVKTIENQMTRALKQLREILRRHQYLSILF